MCLKAVGVSLAKFKSLAGLLTPQNTKKSLKVEGFGLAGDEKSHLKNCNHIVSVSKTCRVWIQESF